MRFAITLPDGETLQWLYTATLKKFVNGETVGGIFIFR